DRCPGQRRILDRFFFRAEDGIRDFHVTGVQTCALPISDTSTRKVVSDPDKTRRRTRTSNANEPVAVTRELEPEFEQPKPSVPPKIGRASCREGVAAGGVAVRVNSQSTDRPRAGTGELKR